MKILLGYETGTAREVYVEPSHIVVTGLTQKSGKTTCLEALARRSGQTVLVFQTKPGEAALLGDFHQVPPFFTEHSDWQYVEALLSAIMKEKMKFERSWIIRATKGTSSLEEVDKRCDNFAMNAKAGSLEQGIFTNLHAYFGIVLPELKRIQEKVAFSTRLELKPGINLMDLTDMKDEVQSLIIRSVLEHVQHNLKGIISIIPELWKFVPEGRGNPVKPVLEALIRQGAGKENFLWFDSQDLAGVDKSPLKQVFTWIMGLQTERNEVQHTLDQIPLGKKEKPTAETIMKLQVGHFILATPQMVKNVYVLPSWLDPEAGRGIALGLMRFEEVPEVQRRFRQAQMGVAEAEKMNESVYKSLYEKTVAQAKELQKAITETVEPLRREIAESKQEAAENKRKIEELQAETARLQRVTKEYEGLDNFLVERMENIIEQKLGKGFAPNSGALTLMTNITRVKVEKAPDTHVKVSDKDLSGKILKIMLEGPKGKRWEPKEVSEQHKNRWGEMTPGVISVEMGKLIEQKILGKGQGRDATHYVYFVPEGLILE